MGLAANPSLQAATRASANYSMSAETLDGGGHAASSANYSTVSSVEVATIGNSSSANQTLHHGFIQSDETAPANLPPIVMDDSAAVDEDSSLVVAAPGVLANDSDPNGDDLSAAVASGPSHGVLLLNADGSFSYTPDPNFNGADSFTYVANDGTVDSSAATVNITVAAVNDAPVALAQSLGTDEDVEFNGVLTGSDVDGDALSFAKITDPSHGSVSVNPDGTFTYTPAPNFNGPDSFSFVANDGTVDSAPADVSIVVEPVNDAPLAGNDSYTTPEDAVLNVSAPGVLGNDGDVDGDALSALLVTGPAHGSLTLNPDGSFSFTPNADYNGPDSFTYQASDGALGSVAATVNVTINAVNDPPVFALGGDVTVDEDSGTYSATQATSIDDGDPNVDQTLTFNVSNDNNTLFSVQPAIATDGTLTFTPSANSNGVALVTVSLSDDDTAGGPALTTADQTFIITVKAVNDLPVFTLSGDVNVDEDSGSYSAAQATGIDDGDPEVEQSLMFNITNDNNSLFSVQPTLTADGTLTFTPAANSNGVPLVTVSLSDDNKAGGDALTSADQTFTITVKAVNDLPIFTLGGDITVNEDSGAYSSAQATGIDDGDPEVEQSLTFKVSNDDNGLFSVQPTLTADGTLTFTPAANSNGVALVTVSLSDDDTAGGLALTTPNQTFTITVNAVNDLPVFTLGGDVVVDEDSGAYSAAQATGIDDGDPEVEQSLTFHVSNNNNALFSVQPTLAADGMLTFTPAPNSNGVAQVTVSLTDDNTAGSDALTTADQTFSVTVNAVDDPPVIALSAASQSVHYSDTIADVTITVEDIDSDASSLTLSAPELPDALKLSKTASWTLDGTAKASWTLSGQVLVGAGQYDITFTARDGTADSDSETHTLTVLPEGAVVYFDETNPVAQPVAAPGGNSGSFAMTFYVVEEWPDQPNDGSEQYGDLNKIAGADVTVTLVPVGQGSSVSGACNLVPVAGTGYDQVLEVQCAFDDVPVNTYTFQVEVNGDYFIGDGDDTLVVYDSSLGYTTGGGSFFWPGTQIVDNSGNVVYRGDRTTFGYTMKYNKQGTKVQGGFKAIRHLASGKHHRIKSNALYGLAVSTTKDPYGWASFAGKTTYQAPDWLEPEGNYEFMVYVEDWREPNEKDAPSDRVWLEVQDKDGNVVAGLSLPRAQDGSGEVYPEDLVTGNIVAPRETK